MAEKLSKVNQARSGKPMKVTPKKGGDGEAERSQQSGVEIKARTRSKNEVPSKPANSSPQKAEKASEPVFVSKAHNPTGSPTQALPQQQQKAYSARALAVESWDESAKLMDELDIGGLQGARPARAPASVAHTTASVQASTTSTAKTTATSTATVTTTATSTMSMTAAPPRPRRVAVEPINLAEEFADAAAQYLDGAGGPDHDGFWKYVELGMDALRAHPESETRKGIAEAIVKGPSLDKMSKPQRMALLVRAARCDMVGTFLAQPTVKPKLKEIMQLLHAAMGVHFEGEQCFWAGPINHRSIKQLADFMKKHEAELGKAACAKLVERLEPIVNGIAASPFQGRSELGGTFQAAFQPFRN